MSDLGPVEFGGGSESRISKYFENERDQDLYEEICQHGWDGMVNHTLQIWFGEHRISDTETINDFGFAPLQHRRN
tara:strand:+ start:7816 stop:8040 length:225 start_codon:yes stop_codon:yes gene_type:complete